MLHFFFKKFTLQFLFGITKLLHLHSYTLGSLLSNEEYLKPNPGTTLQLSLTESLMCKVCTQHGYKGQRKNFHSGLGRGWYEIPSCSKEWHTTAPGIVVQHSKLLLGVTCTNAYISCLTLATALLRGFQPMHLLYDGPRAVLLAPILET